MKKYYYPIGGKEDFTFNAGWKAKLDAQKIFIREGYSSIINNLNTPVIRYLNKKFLRVRIKRNSIFICQFPYKKIKNLNVYKIVKKCKRSICLLHDIETLQGYANNLSEELMFIFAFKIVIVHTKKMEELLINYGYKGRIIILEAFDYLCDNKEMHKKNFSNTITIAANLDLTPYTKHLNEIVKCAKHELYFDLYGVGNKNFLLNKNIRYKGTFQPDNVSNSMLGSYGLVWYGSNLKICSNGYNDYIKYIYPHKVSCYLAHGIPVIAWKKSGCAKFIKENKIGILVDSLYDINLTTLKKNYKIMQKNCLILRNKIITGHFLKTAIKKAESISLN